MALENNYLNSLSMVTNCLTNHLKLLEPHLRTQVGAGLGGSFPNPLFP